ncbi:hypothetical protein C7212DRAFT_345216 [Tuber magnatum]|uniref:Carbonic anhydrase n=1 Tax=Tuber magnatum TaxID=42249 RepID=A0A317SLA1_9PEZI|nr:hypothetical protein C7212DRAFT_345216 [Tuber magnatum]
MAAPPSSQNIQDIRANEEYARNFPEHWKNLPAAPSYRLLIVTCMDARFHPTSALGLSMGSTHIVRNAGGSAEEVVRSIVSQQALQTNEILLVKHTDYGMYPGVDVGPEVVRDVNLLRGHPGVSGIISGWVYDVKTWAVRRIL